MVENRKLDKMINEAQQLTEAIVAKKDEISRMAKDGKDVKDERAKLAKLIEKEEAIAARVTDMQYTIIESKESEELERRKVRTSEKIKNVKTSELLDMNKVVEPKEGQAPTKRKQREFTIDQIKAAGLSTDYLGLDGKGKAFEKEDRVEGNRYRCVWHPWRQAYAICSYCQKPFCFEDLVEKRGRFYCLEDVDKTPLPGVKVEHSYESLNMVGGGLLMISFIIFIYFGYSQFVYQASNLVGVLPSITRGFIVLSEFMNPISLFSLFGALFTFIGFVSGIMVLGHGDRAFVSGIVIGTFSTILFSYAYLSYLQTYTLAISALSFVSIIMLLLSKGAEFTNIEKEEEADYANVNLANISTY